jgi:hypothetical protein
MLGFYGLASQQRLSITPFSNRAHSRLHKQWRAAYMLEVRNRSITADNYVQPNSSFDALALRVFRINGFNTRD